MSCMVTDYSISYAPRLSCSSMHLRGRRVTSAYLHYNPQHCLHNCQGKLCCPRPHWINLSCVTSTVGNHVPMESICFSRVKLAFRQPH